MHRCSFIFVAEVHDQGAFSLSEQIVRLELGQDSLTACIRCKSCSPDTTQVLTNGDCPFTTSPDHKDWISLPRYFRDSGYQTAGMGKVWHPGVCDGTAVGEEKAAWSIPYFHAPAPWYVKHTILCLLCALQP